MKKLIILLILTILILPVTGLILFSELSHASVVWQDDFEYVVDRDASDKSAFTTIGPWTSVKSLPAGNAPPGGPCGYTYTTTSIPGYAGSFPGTASTRVLASEHLPQALGCTSGTGVCGDGQWRQSDTYVSKWAHTRFIPPTFYVQFWFYINNYGSQLTTFQASKFLYPCGQDIGTGTCTESTGALIIGRNATSGGSAFAGVPYEEATPSGGGTYIWDQTLGDAAYACSGCETENYGKLGVNMVPEANAHFSYNTWYLIRMYHDFSTNNPIYRMWRRTQAESDFTLVTEYVDGVTPNLTWTPTVTSGFYRLNFFEMIECGNAYFYVDDFIMATTEDDLPDYLGASAPATPSGITVIYD